MDRSLAVGFVALALSGCASWPDKPRLCFASEPMVAPQSAAEAKAVAFVKRQEADSCRPVDVECNLELRREPEGGVRVVSSKAFLSGNPAACTRLEGGFKTYVFSPQGELVRVELGL